MESVLYEIIDRATKYGIEHTPTVYTEPVASRINQAYVDGATEQREIDIEKAQCAICLAFYTLQNNNSNITKEFIEKYMNSPFMKLFLEEMKGE